MADKSFSDVFRTEVKTLLLNNKIQSNTFWQAPALTRLFGSPLVKNMDEEWASYMSGDNDQSTIEVSQSAFPDAKPFGVVDDDTVKPEVVKALYKKSKVKYLDVVIWYGWNVMQKTVSRKLSPIKSFTAHFADAWGGVYSGMLGSILAGITEIPGNFYDGKAANFSREAVLKAIAAKGEQFYQERKTMVMNVRTFSDIMLKQSTIPTMEKLITTRADKYIIDKDGVKVELLPNRVGLEMTSHVYDGNIPIMFNDKLKNGMISLVNDGALQFGRKNVVTYPGEFGSVGEGVFLYDKDGRAGGLGSEAFGSNQKFMVGALGYTFIGVNDPTSDPASTTIKGKYQKDTFITDNEWARGGMFELNTTTALNPFTNLLVKYGE